MERVLQALLVSPDPMDRWEIVNGRKVASIRQGTRDYRPGLLMLCCQLEPWCVLAEIPPRGIRHCLLSQVTVRDQHRAGFPTRRDMFDRLRKIYPAMKPNSPVTIIRWINVQGKFVDQPHLHEAHLATLKK